MSTVIKASHAQEAGAGVAFNLNDVVEHANRLLQEARSQATQIIAQAQADADQIRARAADEGRAAAIASVDGRVKEQVAQEVQTLTPALAKLIDELIEMRNQWACRWETRAVHVATRIAEKVLHCEVVQRPQLTTEVVRHALELAAGSSQIRLRLSPRDHELLGAEAAQLVQTISRVAPTEVTADPAIAPGGCIIETKHGVIDASLAAQLDRIEHELTQHA